MMNFSRGTKMRRIERWTEFIINAVKNRKVLDVGACGDDAGRLHSKIVENAESVLGIDINREAIERVNEFGYNIIYADAEEFNLSEKFDVIIASELIEHIDAPGRFLERAKVHLNNSGLLVLTTPNAHSLFHVRGKEPYPSHVALYDFHVLRNLLTKHGFEIVKRCYLDLGAGPLEKILCTLYPPFSGGLGVIAKVKS